MSSRNLIKIKIITNFFIHVWDARKGAWNTEEVKLLIGKMYKRFDVSKKSFLQKKSAKDFKI